MIELRSEHFGGAVKVLSSIVSSDNRGSLTINYLESEIDAILGRKIRFVRQMFGRSKKNVVRGLHLQAEPAMGKLMQVINGSAFLVAVDMRIDSPTFLKYHSIVASAENALQVWAPAEFARGYCALEDNTVVQYNCDAYHGMDEVIRWNDPLIAIDWPLTSEPILSERDKKAQRIRPLWGYYEED